MQFSLITCTVITGVLPPCLWQQEAGEHLQLQAQLQEPSLLMADQRQTTLPPASRCASPAPSPGEKTDPERPECFFPKGDAVYEKDTLLSSCRKIWMEETPKIPNHWKQNWYFSKL
ncbi:unnamed protein product, partial [Bubo scandiacus]